MPDHPHPWLDSPPPSLPDIRSLEDLDRANRDLDPWDRRLERDQPADPTRSPWFTVCIVGVIIVLTVAVYCRLMSV